MSITFGEVIMRISPTKSPIESITCTSDSQKLIVGQAATDEETPTLSIVDINTGNLDKMIERSDHFDNAVWRLVIDKNDHFIFYLKKVADKYQIYKYNIKTEEKKIIMETEDSNEYKGFIIGPENQFVIGIENNIQFIDIETDEVIKSININESKTISDHHCYTSLAFSSDGNLLGIGGLNKGEVLLYDLQNEMIINHLSAKFDFPREIVFDPTGKYIFILDYWTKGMFIWNLQTNNWHMEEIFNENWPHVSCIDFCKENPQKVVMGSLNSFVVFFDIEELEELFSDHIHKARVYDVFFTPDKKKLVSSGEDWQIIVRNVEL